MKRLRSSGIFFIMVGVVGYSFFPVLVKLIQRSGMEPLDIAIWRFSLALPMIWLLIFAARLQPPEEPLPRWGLLGLGCVLVLAALSAFYGLDRLPASLFTLLFYSNPAMVALINFVRGERMPALAWLALLLTLVGVGLTMPHTGADLGDQATVGVLLAFVNAFLVALYFILNNHLVRDGRAARRASAWTITGACLAAWVLSALHGVNLPPDLGTAALLLLLAFFSTVIPVFSFTLGIQILGASRAAIFSTLEPVGTALLSFILLSERLDPIQVLGGALILGSVLLLQASRRQARQPVTPLTGGD